jgi:putative membrane protein
MGGTTLSRPVLALILAAAALYVCGLARLWRRAGAGRGIGLAHSACAAAGFLALLFALESPLHEMAEKRLWAHMIQHEVLMVVAAPLLVLGRLAQALAFVVPLRLPRWLADPLLAWTLHAAAIVFWHMPSAFAAALANPWLHFAQHASFFVTGLLFWWTLDRRFAAMASLFATMMYTGALGALMALARYPWYAGYALEDQQLAGLVMWIPAGLAYPLAALFIGWQWLRRSAAHS